MTHERLAALANARGVAELATPAILLDEAAAAQNIARMVELVGADHWRPHVKTARTRWAIGRLRAAGVTRFKAATLAEVEALLDAGAEDVLLAYPAIGPLRAGLAELAGGHPQARVAALVDDPSAVTDWPRALGAFVDLDTGMHRTGVDVADTDAVLALVAALATRGVPLRGLHAYDGHLADHEPAPRRAEVERRRAEVDALVFRLVEAGFPSAELCLGSSHTFPDVRLGPDVTVGVGTAVYNDARSLARYALDPATSGFVPAAGVLSRVVSRRAGQVTLDAGLAAIQVDAGRPHAVVAGRPDLAVGAPSQEHLVVTGDVDDLAPGDRLMLLPRHLDTALTQVDLLYRVAPDGTLTPEPVITPRRSRRSRATG